ncbi:hypothetical protein [uncultured Campylobacter sp.]|nr:hypothetical protein [uncultured Campylobacter sp.]
MNLSNLFNPLQAAGMEEIAASSRGLADSARNLHDESVKFKV